MSSQALREPIQIGAKERGPASVGYSPSLQSAQLRWVPVAGPADQTGPWSTALAGPITGGNMLSETGEGMRVPVCNTKCSFIGHVKISPSHVQVQPISGRSQICLFRRGKEGSCSWGGLITVDGNKGKTRKEKITPSQVGATDPVSASRSLSQRVPRAACKHTSIGNEMWQLAWNVTNLGSSLDSQAQGFYGGLISQVRGVQNIPKLQTSRRNRGFQRHHIVNVNSLGILGHPLLLLFGTGGNTVDIQFPRQEESGLSAGLSKDTLRLASCFFFFPPSFNLNSS